MIRTSTHVLPDGTTVERYKNTIGDKISHQPRLLMQWGVWVCISHNARGVGRSGTYAGALEAFSNWYFNNKRFVRAQEAQARSMQQWRS